MVIVIIVVCLKFSKFESKWYLDSGCLRHMTGNANLFLSLEKKDGGGMCDNKLMFVGERVENIYVIDLHALSNKDIKCFISISDNSRTWHRKLAHASMELLMNLNKDELVDRLPKIKFQKDKVCNAWYTWVAFLAHKDECFDIFERKGNLDELTFGVPQSSETQDQLKDDPLKDSGDNEIELQEQQGQLVPH
ncbi:uncharacterized protein LOC131177906 [Hevea brasiliensis]|uniref:uncharacterized protein LOC131177906 n=1 Tax=Hevea brasiliensis TaxID=3981 RepID=UPI002600371D|nr:uncharacterized protein LOC131177906 [Hevea brasiliensis]